MVKLLKLLIDFGKFQIEVTKDVQKTEQKNQEFFTILRALIAIFEFDKTYPEARKILIENREE